MKILQYLLWTNCNNACKFCIRGDKSDAYSKTEDMLASIQKAKSNILSQDWSSYKGGISIIGGELYYVEDRKLQLALLDLMHTATDVILKKNDSTCIVLITNLIYNDSFLKEVLHQFEKEGVLNQVHLHTSFDLKYRYKDNADKQLMLSNLEDLSKEFSTLNLTTQTILTQYFIDAVNDGSFNISEFEEKYNTRFTLLVPLYSNLSSTLSDFFPKRRDFINFLIKLYDENPITFRKFIDSARYAFSSKDFIDTQNDRECRPSNSVFVTSDMMKCGHYDIYRVYSDSDKCMLCDIEALCQRGGTKFE